MRFPVEKLFAAFQRVGLTEAAVFAPGTPQERPFSVGWLQPDQLVLGEEQQSAEYLIEFETGSVPRIARGAAISVAGVLYRARAPAVAQGDGYFSRCALERP